MKTNKKQKIFLGLLFTAIVLDGITTDLASAIPFLATISNTIWAIIEGGLAIGVFANIKR